jgi:hypothetical protein
MASDTQTIERIKKNQTPHLLRIADGPKHYDLMNHDALLPRAARRSSQETAQSGGFIHITWKERVRRSFQPKEDYLSVGIVPFPDHSPF